MSSKSSSDVFAGFMIFLGCISGLFFGVMLCSIVASPSPEEAARLVRGEFPQASIVRVSKTRFFVADSGACYYVVMDGFISFYPVANEVDCPELDAGQDDE